MQYGIRPQDFESLSYHWLLGLTYRPNAQASLGRAAQVLMENPEGVQAISEQLNRHAQRPPFVRFLMWVFNINNYAYHCYLMVTLSMYLESLPHSLKRNIQMETFSNLFTLQTAVILGLSAIGFKIYSLSMRYRPTEPTDPEFYRRTDDTPPDSPDETIPRTMVITNAMLVHLQALNIEARPGERIAESTYKKAYKTLALKTHPDKGGKKEDFINVSAARDALDTHFTASPEGERPNVEIIEQLKQCIGNPLTERLPLSVFPENGLRQDLFLDITVYLIKKYKDIVDDNRLAYLAGYSMEQRECLRRHLVGISEAVLTLGFNELLLCVPRNAAVNRQCQKIVYELVQNALKEMPWLLEAQSICKKYAHLGRHTAQPTFFKAAASHAAPATEEAARPVP